MSGEMLAARRAALLDMIFKTLGIEGAADRTAGQDARAGGGGDTPPATEGADDKGQPPSQE
jgi:hypothetical protein